MKARYTTEPEPVQLIRMGDKVQVFIAVNPTEKEEEREGTVEKFWEVDYNEFVADAATLDTDALLAHPERFLDYDPARMAALYKQGEDALQAFIDQTATEKGYTNSYTLLSYLQSPDAEQAAQAATFNQWRYEAQSAAKAIFAAVASGERTAPTVEEFVAELPKIVWPE